MAESGQIGKSPIHRAGGKRPNFLQNRHETHGKEMTSKYFQGQEIKTIVRSHMFIYMNFF